MAPLLPFGAVTPGNARGVPQLLLGPEARRHVGAPTVVGLYPDLKGNVWPVVTVEMSHRVLDRLKDAGERCDPLWPAIVRNSFQQVGWDGFTSLEHAAAVHIPGAIVSWLHDTAGVHLAIVPDSSADVSPVSLITALARTGAVTGWADAEGHEERWLRDNLAVYAPKVDPPVPGDLLELRRGLAYVTGWKDLDDFHQHAGYLPAPAVSRAGTIEMRRVMPKTPPRRLMNSILRHRVRPRMGPGGLVDVVESGMLLSQRRRRLVGQIPAVGWSEQADREAGIAEFVFSEVDDADAGLPSLGLVWTDPQRLLSRLDFVAIPYDPIQRLYVDITRVNPAFVLDPTGHTLDRPDVYTPQVGVSGALDLFSEWGPNLIVVRDAAERVDVLKALRASGVSTMQGRPAADAVVVNECFEMLASVQRTEAPA